MDLLYLTRSAVIAFILAGLVTFQPGLRTFQIAEAAGAPLPLPRFTETAIPAAQGEIVDCTGANRIFQGCRFTGGTDDTAWYRLELQAIADLLKLHQLPADDKARLLGWERDAVRARIFELILQIIKKDPAQRTADERAIYDQLAAFVKANRLAAATFSRNEYTSWANNPCGYVAPPTFRYSIPTNCASPHGNLFGGPPPPSLEEFQNYGSAHVMIQFQTNPALQASAAETGKSVGLVAGGVGVTVAFMAILKLKMVMMLGTPAALWIANTTVPVVAGAGAVAGIAAIVIVALTIAVVQGINVFTAAEIPGKLDAAVTAAQVTPDLKQLITTDAGERELFTSFLTATMPDYPATSGVPTAKASDPRFELDPGPSAQVSTTLHYKSWDGSVRTAFMSDGWFVDSAAGTSRLSLEIDYLDWDGKGWTAWRIGDQFLHRQIGDANATRFESDSIKYKDATGANRTARFLGPDRTGPTANPVFSPPPNAAGWNNTPVTVTWNWSDGPTGVGIDPAACRASSGLTPCSIVVEACKDLAGNTGSTSASVKIDTKAPVFTGPPTLSPPPNAAGWHNTDVSVTFACNDGEQPGAIYPAGTEPSGIASCGPTRTLTSEGRNQSVTGTATDVAGNTATQTKDGINIDKTPPAFPTPPTDRSLDATSASGAPVTYPTPTATDALDPAPKVACLPASGGTFAIGPTTVTCTATDHAGNQATSRINVTVRAVADLSVTKSGPNGQVSPGDPLSYTLTVRNAGPSPAMNAVFTDELPPHTVFQSISSLAGWTCETPAVGMGGTVRCTHAGLPVGGPVTFTLMVKVLPTAPGGLSITNTASITSVTTDLTTSNNSRSASTLVRATVSNVTPTFGPTAGGTMVTIAGSGFQPGAQVLFGGVPATSVQVPNATIIRAVSPPHAQGTVNVTISLPNGKGGTITNGFTYRQ